MATRKEVLQLYKKALKLARTWRASDPMQTTQEKEYIVEEARRLFRKNINLCSTEEIHQCIKEADARIELARHYNCPYPRPSHLPQGLVRSTSGMSKSKQLQQHSKPPYVKSL